jgi:hypothetical protein
VVVCRPSSRGTDVDQCHNVGTPEQLLHQRVRPHRIRRIASEVRLVRYHVVVQNDSFINSGDHLAMPPPLADGSKADGPATRRY